MTTPLQRAILAIGLLTAACAAGTVPPQSGTPATTTAPSDGAHRDHMTALPATAGPGYTEADVRFMQHMIGHHAQALRMTAMVGERTSSDDLIRLAQKIDISQSDEIAMMRQWLEERSQAVPADDAHAMMMPGMLTPAQLAQLAAARGREFDRLFLAFMIRHHQGALQMVEELFDSPRAGQDPDIFRFATDVDADQRDEIYVMQTLLDSIERD